MADMEIALALHGDHIEVIFTNNSSIEMRFWEIGNSWGWWTISFQIRENETGDISTILRLWNMSWSKNAPSTFEVSPNTKQELSINLNDGYWIRDHTISRLLDKPLYIRVSYHSDTLSADEFEDFVSSHIPELARRRREQITSIMANLFVGSAVSDWVISQPPHNWLFSQNSLFVEPVDQLIPHSPEQVLGRVSNHIGELAWLIKDNVGAINSDSHAPFMEIKKDYMNTAMTVGHCTTSILEYAEKVHLLLKEVEAYLKAKGNA